jgi:DNA-binding response OmpR family regulator
MRQPVALVIEDDAHIAQLLAIATKAAGYETEVVRSGSIAVRRLLEVVPDLIILDLHLPAVHGVDILKGIRSEKRFAATRVFVVTANHLEAEQVQKEADLVLLKPLSFLQLRDMALRFRPGVIETNARLHRRKASPVGCTI